VCTYAPFVIQAEKPTSVSLQSQNYLYPVRVDVGGAKTCQNHMKNLFKKISRLKKKKKQISPA